MPHHSPFTIMAIVSGIIGGKVLGARLLVDGLDVFGCEGMFEEMLGLVGDSCCVLLGWILLPIDVSEVD
jgi:hypothetical protein